MNETAQLEADLIYWQGPPVDGFALVVPGHGHGAVDLAALAESEGYSPHEATEVWLSRHRRIMWCERLTGFGCDSNGDWHTHYEPVRPNPCADDAKWTLLTHAAPVPHPAAADPSDGGGGS